MKSTRFVFGRALAVLCALLFVSFGFMSCQQEDETEYVNYSLTGTWVNSYSGGTSVYKITSSTFDNSGTSSYNGTTSTYDSYAGNNLVVSYTNDEETIVDLGIPIIVFGDHTRVLKYIQFPFAKGADGTQLIVTNNEKMPQSLFYCSLVNVDLSNYHYARHFKYLKAEEILLPSLDVAHQFDGVVSPLFEQVQMLRDKCKLAAEARDRLLPKLMSGEIEV